MEEISLKDIIKILLNDYKLIINLTAFAIIGAFIVWLITPKLFDAHITLKVDTIDINPSITGENGTLIGDISTIARFPTMDISTFQQQITSNEVLEKTIETLGLYDKDGIPVKPIALEGRITVTADDKTNMLYITTTDATAQGAESLANTLVSSFIQQLDTLIQTSCSNTLANLDRQLLIQKQRLDQETAKLKDYSETPLNALVIESSIRSLISQITQYKADLNDLQRKLDSGKKSIASLIDFNSAYPVSNFRLNTPYNTNDFSDTASNGASSIEVDLSGDIGSAVMALKKAEIETGIIQNESEYESLTAIITEMETNLSHLQAISAEEQQKYNILQMNYSLASEIYSKYQKIYQQIPVISASNIAEKNIMILSEGTASKNPTNGSVFLYIAIGTILGLFTAAFVVLFKSYWVSN